MANIGIEFHGFVFIKNAFEQHALINCAMDPGLNLRSSMAAVGCLGSWLNWVRHETVGMELVDVFEYYCS